jgi:hypothetical protein
MTERDPIEEQIGGGDYGPGALDEPSTYRPDKGDDDPGLSSTIPAGTDPEVLRDGGPRDGQGILTTTGGTAGPASFPRTARHGPGVAPTTTGDATTGGMETLEETYISDASSNAVD